MPRLIGDTTAARTVKAARGRSQRIDRDELLAALRSSSDAAEQAGEALLAWAERNPGLELTWSSLADIGLPGDRYPLLRVWPDAMLELRLDTLRFDHEWDPPRIEEFVARVSQIDGLTLGRGRKWPRVPLTPLADPHVLREFLAIVDELVDELAH